VDRERRFGSAFGRLGQPFGGRQSLLSTLESKFESRCRPFNASERSLLAVAKLPERQEGDAAGAGYRLRALVVRRLNQVWVTDVTCASEGEAAAQLMHPGPGPHGCPYNQGNPSLGLH
jgi:hypothetical protein